MRKAPDKTSPVTYRLSKYLIVRMAQTNHKRSHCGATGIGEEFRGCGINFHTPYDAFLVQKNVVQHKLRSSAAGAKRSESAEGSRDPHNCLFYRLSPRRA